MVALDVANDGRLAVRHGDVLWSTAIDGERQAGVAVDRPASRVVPPNRHRAPTSVGPAARNEPDVEDGGRSGLRSRRWRRRRERREESEVGRRCARGRGRGRRRRRGGDRRFRRCCRGQRRRTNRRRCTEGDEDDDGTGRDTADRPAPCAANRWVGRPFGIRSQAVPLARPVRPCPEYTRRCASAEWRGRDHGQAEAGGRRPRAGSDEAGPAVDPTANPRLPPPRPTPPAGARSESRPRISRPGSPRDDGQRVNSARVLALQALFRQGRPLRLSIVWSRL